MAGEVNELYSLQFTNAVRLLLQQRTARFDAHIDDSGSYVGEGGQVVVQFGAVDFQERTVSMGDTQFAELINAQRWIFPDTFDLALPIQKQDTDQMVVSLDGPYVAAMGAGWNRRKDDTVIGAFFASAATGKKGATSTPFDTNMVVQVTAGATGATGLNVEKLIQARELLAAGEVDLELEMPRIAVSQKQISDMLRQTEVTNKDYAAIARLEKGEVDEFMGFKFVKTQRLPVDGSGYRRNPFWVPSGMHRGSWGSFVSKISERNDKKHIRQIYMEGTIAATRTEEKKVGEIKCAES